MSAISKDLLGTTAEYRIERVAMQQMAVMAGQQRATWSNVVTGQLPKVKLFDMIHNDAFIGAHDKTLYSFYHFRLAPSTQK